MRQVILELDAKELEVLDTLIAVGLAEKYDAATRKAMVGFFRKLNEAVLNSVEARADLRWCPACKAEPGRPCIAGEDGRAMLYGHHEARCR